MRTADDEEMNIYRNNKYQSETLTLVRLQGVFFLWLICLCLSTLVFLIQILYFKFHFNKWTVNKTKVKHIGVRSRPASDCGLHIIPNQRPNPTADRNNITDSARCTPTYSSMTPVYQ